MYVFMIGGPVTASKKPKPKKKTKNINDFDYSGLEYRIGVMQAAQSGKEIQCRGCGVNSCWRTTRHPVWNWDAFDYRVKPEPKGRWMVMGLGENGQCLGATAANEAEAARWVRDYSRYTHKVFVPFPED